DSLQLLAEVVQRIAGERWWIDNVDIVIAAEQPRLAPHLEQMRENLLEVLAPLKEPMGHGINVSVRPKRAEGLGAIGRAEGIAVWAVALLSRGECSSARRPTRATLSRCCASRTRRDAQRSNSSPASRARCRCTCAGPRRTTCRIWA